MRNMRTPRWRERNEDASKHEDESEDPNDGKPDDNAGDQGCDSDDSEEDTRDHHGVGRATVPTRRARHKIGIVVIETALHFFKEPLLLLGKWHSVYLTHLGDVRQLLLNSSRRRLARLGVCL
jgi:hypothetical protein